MSAASYARFTSLLALMALAGAFAVVVFRRRLAGGFTVRMALSGGLAVALASTLGSLGYSEVYNMEPCVLCWYQRIAMYPLVLVFGLAIVFADGRAFRYAASLAGVGATLSIIHLIEQWTPADIGACALGVPCSVRYVEEFGFVTIPFMALAGFLAILSFAWLAAALETEEVEQ
jgi:disulfide bond formation protein DsbB